mgnify:CR=1 FL=1
MSKFIFNKFKSFLILCKSETVDGKPALGCNREYAEVLLKNRMYEEPWYGIEQEYTLFEKDCVTPLGWPNHNGKLGFPAPQGPYYCAVGTNNIIGREIVESKRRAINVLLTEGVDTGLVTVASNLGITKSKAVRFILLDYLVKNGFIEKKDTNGTQHL